MQRNAIFPRIANAPDMICKNNTSLFEFAAWMLAQEITIHIRVLYSYFIFNEGFRKCAQFAYSDADVNN